MDFEKLEQVLQEIENIDFQELKKLDKTLKNQKKFIQEEKEIFENYKKENQEEYQDFVIQSNLHIKKQGDRIKEHENRINKNNEELKKRLKQHKEENQWEYITFLRSLDQKISDVLKVIDSFKTEQERTTVELQEDIKTSQEIVMESFEKTRKETETSLNKIDVKNEIQQENLEKKIKKEINKTQKKVEEIREENLLYNKEIIQDYKERYEELKKDINNILTIGVIVGIIVIVAIIILSWL